MVKKGLRPVEKKMLALLQIAKSFVITKELRYKMFLEADEADRAWKQHGVLTNWFCTWKWCSKQYTEEYDIWNGLLLTALLRDASVIANFLNYLSLEQPQLLTREEANKIHSIPGVEISRFATSNILLHRKPEVRDLSLERSTCGSEGHSRKKVHKLEQDMRKSWERRKKEQDEGSNSILETLKSSIWGLVFQNNVIWLYELHLRLYKYGTASMFTLYSRIASICVHRQRCLISFKFSEPIFPSVQMMWLGILFNNCHNVHALLLAICTSLFISGIFSNSCGSSIDYLPSRISNSYIIRNRAAAATKLLVDGCHVWKRLPERWSKWSK